MKRNTAAAIQAGKFVLARSTSVLTVDASPAWMNIVRQSRRKLHNIHVLPDGQEQAQSTPLNSLGRPPAEISQ